MVSKNTLKLCGIGASINKYKEVISANSINPIKKDIPEVNIKAGTAGPDPSFKRLINCSIALNIFSSNNSIKDLVI